MADVWVTDSDLLKARNDFRNGLLKQLLDDREAYERRRREEVQASYQRYVTHQAQADHQLFFDIGEYYRVRGLARADFTAAFDPFPREREALEAREAALRANWDEPVVWSRTTAGAPLKIYHYTTHCGHVSGAGRHPDLFRAQFEPEAVARSLKPCRYDVCGWAFEALDGFRTRERR